MCWRDLIREHFVALDIARRPRDRGSPASSGAPAVGHLKVATVDSAKPSLFQRTRGLVQRDR